MKSLKIFPDFYVFSETFSSGEGWNFFCKDSIERVEYLSELNPSVKIITKTGNGGRVYTPSLGEFIVSKYSKIPVKCDDEVYAKTFANNFSTELNSLLAVMSLGLSEAKRVLRLS